MRDAAGAGWSGGERGCAGGVGWARLRSPSSACPRAASRADADPREVAIRIERVVVLLAVAAELVLDALTGVRRRVRVVA